MINNPGVSIAVSSMVPITRKINGHDLSDDIALTASDIGAIDAGDPFIWRTFDLVRPEGIDGPVAVTPSTTNTTFNVGYLRNYSTGTTTHFWYRVKLPFPIYTNLYTYQIIVECWGNVLSTSLYLYEDIDSDSALGGIKMLYSTKSSADQEVSDYLPYYQKTESFINAIANWQIYTCTGTEWVNTAYVQRDYNNDVTKTSFVDRNGIINYVGISLGAIYSNGAMDLTKPWYTYAARVSYRACIDTVR